jgi:Flp pilus assembly protein TadG
MRTSARRIAGLPRRLCLSRRAASAVEMAFIAPVLVFLAAGLIDFGLGIYVKMVVSDAAQAGAAYALVNATNFNGCTSNAPPCAWDTSVQSAATNAHQSGMPLLATAPAATAQLLCCTVSGGTVVPTGASSTCSQPPASGTCASPNGTYVFVTVSSQLTTLIPYSFANGLMSLGFNITNPLTLQANYLVRIQ